MNKLEKIIAAITIAILPGCLGVYNGYRGPPKRNCRNCADVNSSSIASIATITTSTIAPVNTTSRQLPNYEQNQQAPEYFDWEEVDGQYKF